MGLFSFLSYNWKVIKYKEKYMKKIYALTNIIIAIAAFVFGIVNYSRNHSIYSFHEFWGFVWLALAIVAIVIGVLQIINYAKNSKNWIELAAGLSTVLVFVPFAGIAALVFNIIIVVKSKK